MLTKLKITLAAFALAGLVIDGGYYLYCHFGADISSSKIVRELGGE